MDKLVKRVTVVHGTGANRETVVVYEDESLNEEQKRRTSRWLRPLERFTRRMLKADLIGAQEAYQRHLNSSRNRKNGWLRDVEKNYEKASRKAYNEARKMAPIVLPKA
jgi:Family of unknown function (DUF6312)